MLSVRVFALSILLVNLLFGLPVKVAGNDNDIPQWRDGSVGTDVWQSLPGQDDVFGHGPSQGTEDPFIFEYLVACVTPDQAIFPQCAASLPRCDAATDGTAVYWYHSLKSATPPVWVFDSGPVCIYSKKPEDVLAKIAAQIGNEFQKSPVQPATIGSQPGPHTLRGKETNFYADAREQNFTITLLGQKVHITATPVAYTWNYGDGDIWGPTPSAGAPLPEDRVGEQTKTSHVYTATGKYTITVTTHFNGSYSVNGGPTLPIPDQGHITSAPLGLTAWRAITRNYADNCLQNPDGIGC